MIRLAAIFILALLGHGLLMAGDVGAAGYGDEGKPAMSPAAMTPAIDAPAHGEICFTVQTVIESAPLQVSTGARIAPLPNVEPDGIVPPQALVASPHHPPNIVRALLQVYRI